MKHRYSDDVTFSISISKTSLDALRHVDEEILRTIRTTEDAWRIQDIVLKMTMHITGAIAGALFKYDQCTTTFTPVSTNGYPVGLQLSPQRIYDGLMGFAARNGRPVIVSDVSAPE